MLADRINVVEGIVDDLAHGHVPNIFAELGWKAKWEHDRKGLITNVAVGTAVAVAVVAYLNRKKWKKNKKKRTAFWLER